VRLQSNLNEVRLGFKLFSLVNYQIDQSQRHMSLAEWSNDYTQAARTRQIFD
jgi:hypothetical protein